MITIQYALRRKTGMTFDEFSAYWRGPHADLVKSMAPRLGIIRYVQNHAVLPDIAIAMQAMRGTAAPFDGVASISFGSAEELAKANTDPSAAQAQHLLAEDEAKFIDIARSSILFTAEHEVIR